MNPNNKITIALYSHVEFYPPTLNAIHYLAQQYSEVHIVCSNVLNTTWQYPSNVYVHVVGKHHHIRVFMVKSLLYKAIHFLKYTIKLASFTNKHTTILVCDYIPLLSIRIVSVFKKLKFLWYHNHDVTELGVNRKYSIGWFAEHNEPKMFSKIDLFTLPANERKQYFPMEDLKGRYVWVPNYPSKLLYGNLINHDDIYNNELVLIYQGSIAAGHGLETIISLLRHSIHNTTLKLILKGFILDTYKATLQLIIDEHNVQDKVTFVGVTPYQDVPLYTIKAHIGIAIHAGTNRMNSTLGTASNKIYEYAACGLPVLYYSNEHYDAHLKKYEWAIGVQETAISISNAISHIILNYKTLHLGAKASFESSLNFEHNFNTVLSVLK